MTRLSYCSPTRPRQLIDQIFSQNYILHIRLILLSNFLFTSITATWSIHTSITDGLAFAKLAMASRSMRFRPCIDLHHGIVKQIVGSSLDDSGKAPIENFVATKSAAEFALMYKEAGIKGGHVIMLGGGNDEAALSALREFPAGLQIGGGINAANAMKYLDAGASHVIVTSSVFKNGDIDFESLKKLVAVVGKDRLVLDLSCRRGKEDRSTYFVVTDRWQKYTHYSISRDNLETLAAYCDEFLVHGVDVEGMRVGIEEELVSMLAEWSPIPVTYAGGANCLGDLDRVKALGRGKIDLTIGSALDIFGGDVAFADVLEWHHRQ